MVTVANPKPRILVPEKVSVDGLALLSEDYEVDSRPQGLSPEELLTLIPQIDALIVRSETKVTAEVLSAAGSRLRVVARAGVGVDNINVEAATAGGIIVVNSPAGNIVAAAEHTVALLLATARNVGRADRTTKEGRWERGKLVGVEVGRKTLGIVGLGKVGMKVARMCIGLGMKVIAFDPYANPDLARQTGVERLVPRLQDMLPEVDFMTIHTPLLASTLDLIGEAEFKLMKPTARVLNVARGGVYNEAALLDALNKGTIAGAGLDVFTKEPPDENTPAWELLRHEKVVATPHLGASTVEAQENVAVDVCTQVAAVLRGELPTSAVNAPLILPEEYRALKPYAKLIERMGGLYTQHFVSPLSRSVGVGAGHFELVYHGDLAGVSNSRPLLAALIRGLVSPFSDTAGRHVNIVNAMAVAREKGIIIREIHAHSGAGGGKENSVYASSVTLRAVATEDEKLNHEKTENINIGRQVIEGYVSANNVYISRLGRFSANFIPEGTLLILHNFDEPGKIGGVGSVLGRHGINIRFMQVASLDLERSKAGQDGTKDLERKQPDLNAPNGNDDSQQAQASVSEGGSKKKGDEALMILGVGGDVTKQVMEDLRTAEGILNVSLVQL
ncbi:phosphoglycerate dehydrogenase [Xylaria bambusicola]|uniref:phosphoglycerate dehydrogenase n=1 Tax=Xylaria bambusicola TaxID=326684 RepID=UPI002007B214|nr:phosphoglycerate dehydrogenase [Xylaria bambusicola]KAI0514984.1 phosphoglycerate dehydrogenase [Xylaria bambusicola]